MNIAQNLASPNHLLDVLIDKLNLKNDAALSRALYLAPPVISKMRHLKLPVSNSFLINAHEESGLSIADLKKLAGLPAAKPFRQVAR